MLYSLPNLLTLSRIGVIPVLVAAFYLPGSWGNWVAAALFIAAGVTDFFDGLIARRRGQTSALGQFLDPVADKLVVAAAIIMLVWADRAPVLPALVILCREILVSGLREILGQFQVGMPVSRLAKWKTAIQFAALAVLLVGDASAAVIGLSVATLGEVLIWIAAGITLITGYGYLRIGLGHIRGKDTDGGSPDEAAAPEGDSKPAERSV